MLFVYRITINIILLISPIIILVRLLQNKESPKRFKEKFCFFTKKKNKGKLIWFHGASIGEILSIIPLVEKLENNKEIKQILITSNTLSSSKILMNLKLKKTIHQFFPIDTNYHTQQFLNYWKPSVAIFIDSEIWPNMLINLKKKSISLILLNGRITKKSFKRWKIFPLSSKMIFKKFNVCLSSSKKSKNYLKLLGARKIKYIGNLKFTQTKKNEDHLKKDLQKFFFSRKIWCASSTHNSEEKTCLEIHKKLKIKYKKLLTIIIPRHIHRTKKIISEANKLNLKVHTHNTNGIIDKRTDIYLVNSFGLTKTFFKICKVVFLGGSLIKHGGQNPLEAARYGCKIIHGPNVWNFDEVYSLLKKYNVSTKILNSNQLRYKIDNMLTNKVNFKNLELKFKHLGNEILDKTLHEINFFIKNK